MLLCAQQVSAKLRAEATGLRGVIVSALLAASLAHTSARRVLAGVDVRYARLPPGPLELLWAGLLAVATAAGHALARTLIWSKVRAALGVRRTVVSGGGSLSGHLDLWYEALGLPVLNGWGLTETSPVLACRRHGRLGRGACLWACLWWWSGCSCASLCKDERLARWDLGLRVYP